MTERQGNTKLKEKAWEKKKKNDENEEEEEKFTKARDEGSEGVSIIAVV